MKFKYLKTPLYRYTFKNKKVKAWVEENAEGYVLNLFAGKYRLNCDEVRNDLDENMDAGFHMDALDFLKYWHENKLVKFNTVLLDPPYSFRKCMTKYNGVVSSRFYQVKNHILDILAPHGIVITFGYHSNSMGKNRGFKQEHLLVMSHGGAIHDTFAIIERKQDGLTREEIRVFFDI